MYYVYMLTNKSNRVIYIGITNNIKRRVYEHKLLLDGFTKKYKVTKLVYYEKFSDPQRAIDREKQLKRWKRDKKILLIETQNPTWEDLYR